MNCCQQPKRPIDLWKALRSMSYAHTITTFLNVQTNYILFQIPFDSQVGFIEFEKGFNLPTEKGTFYTIGEESHSLQYQRGFWVRFSIIQQKSIFLATICNKTIYEFLLPCLTREERAQSK
jgi:hypothetical protein